MFVRQAASSGAESCTRNAGPCLSCRGPCFNLVRSQLVEMLDSGKSHEQKANVRQPAKYRNCARFVHERSVVVRSHLSLSKSCSGSRVSRKRANVRKPTRYRSCTTFIPLRTYGSGLLSQKPAFVVGQLNS